ncbi:MAG TPA: hypothetical protein VNM45_06155 [Bacillus sp. (in: firmicutes)]|nr:hypothetical protein [Bacillus sp. (in: firmicutes)]
MGRENKPVLSNFVDGDRFELNSYLTYLFHQFYDYVPDHAENQMIKQ